MIRVTSSMQHLSNTIARSTSLGGPILSRNRQRDRHKKTKDRLRQKQKDSDTDTDTNTGCWGDYDNDDGSGIQQHRWAPRTSQQRTAINNRNKCTSSKEVTCIQILPSYRWTASVTCLCVLRVFERWDHRRGVSSLTTTSR